MSSINSIGGSMGYGMAAMRRPDPQEMFKKVDSDGSGGVSQTELQSLTEKISQKSGQSFDAAKMLSEYDSNSDGSLGEDEMKSLMESIRPKHEREAMLNTQGESGSQSPGVDAQSMVTYLSNSSLSDLIKLLKNDSSNSSSSQSVNVIS